MRATVAGDSPPSTRATARRRRRSSSAAVPIGRVMFHYTDVQSGIQALAVLISVGKLNESAPRGQADYLYRELLRLIVRAGLPEPPRIRDDVVIRRASARSYDNWVGAMREWYTKAEIQWEEAGSPPPPPPPPPRLVVDLERMTATLDGTKYDVKSECALRWLKVLVEHPGEWISSTSLKKYDRVLQAPRITRWRKQLPDEISSLINSETGKGSRINL